MVLNDRGDLVSEAEPAVVGDRHVRPAALALFVLIHRCVVLSIAMGCAPAGYLIAAAKLPSP